MTLAILLQLNPSKSDLSRPYDSTQGIPPGVLVVVYSIVLLFIIYTVFKVRKMSRDEGKKRM
jgi:hypothetical protein